MSQPMIYKPEQAAEDRAEWNEFRAANQEAWAAEARHEQTQEEYQQEWADVTDQYEADHYTVDDCAEL